ncbi:flagellar motor switch protein FliM [Aliiruegeria haliotis]|uniref:Flagellar motor switch protein FliM n=1 Tax=Aliiruegeria haliotis TaxID=1280846 RepID=A0A2T0RK40_9RHOB|nr:FliM/FliN family flagellar motor switch protein [Aliiruegeria haliotis]PRY21555.1 flagellar motor switch protein FliM [Aliiruegeria haliotis]
MAEAAAQSVLRRMAAAGRENPAGGRAILPARVLSSGLSRSAENLLSMDTSVSSCSERIVSLTELLEILPEDGLLAILEGPEESLGLMVLDAPFLSALIEKQMTGALSERMPPPRRATRTDAALAADLIDAMLREFEEPFLARSEASWVTGYAYSSHLEDPRPLGLLLEDVDYRVFGLSVQVEAGIRGGRIVLALPAEGRGRPDLTAVNETTTGDDPEWEDKLKAVVLGGEVRLEAVLHRFRVPFEELARLNVGQELPLPAARIDGVKLTSEEGQAFTTGRLGQSHGHRAVRIGSGAALPSPTLDLADALAAAPPATPEIPSAELPPLPLAVSPADHGSTDAGVGADSDSGLPDHPAMDSPAPLDTLPDLGAGVAPVGIGDLPPITD